MPDDDTTTAPRAPLWRQVLDDLQARMASGDIGQRFPTDRELVEHYGVSRHTVREAVRHLKASGVIERERGRGSQVVHPEFVQPLGTLYSLFQAVESQGIRQTNEVLSLDERVDERAAARFGLPADTALVRLERVRFAGGEPLALDTVWMPPDVGRPLLASDFHHTSLYGEMRRHLGFCPTSGEEEIVPVLPDADLREVLGLDPDEAVLRIQRVGRLDERVIECRVTLVRGSRFRLESRWPDEGRATPVIDAGGSNTAWGRDDGPTTSAPRG